MIDTHFWVIYRKSINWRRRSSLSLSWFDWSNSCSECRNILLKASWCKQIEMKSIRTTLFTKKYAPPMSIFIVNSAENPIRVFWFQGKLNIKLVWEFKIFFSFFFYFKKNSIIFIKILTLLEMVDKNVSHQNFHMLSNNVLLKSWLISNCRCKNQIRQKISSKMTMSIHFYCLLLPKIEMNPHFYLI